MIGDTFDSPGSRFDAEGDWLARQCFSETDLQMSPEEYAARHAHQWGCFSFHRYHYLDPVLGRWVRRLGEILFTEGEVARWRSQFLTPEERAQVCREEDEAF